MRMITRCVNSDEVVKGESYLLVKQNDKTKESLFAVWTGDGWTWDNGSDLPADWPDVVFENPNKAEFSDSMTLDEYQETSRGTAVYPDIGKNLVYPTLGLCGETGEFAEKVKKSIRDDGGKITPERKEQMVKELGDVLWYLSAVAHELGISLGDVAKLNIEKLASRQKRDTLQGSGDNR
jgi:NTP pyrophosphatase (non-canonical NTP hydrolase)